ncbi:MAG: amidohydrolase family protein [Myxococcota bacterium]
MDKSLLIINAEVAGRNISVRCRDGVITELADRIVAGAGEEEIDAQGGALIPGLHDHHAHLFSLAADFASVPCGPPAIQSQEALSDSLHRAKPISGWLRGTGYFESVAGDLDRHRLDALGPDLPLRIQHRSGSMWFLNSRAIEALGLDRGCAGDHPGVERDAKGRVTGRFFRADDWLRQQRPATTVPDLRAVGSFLASCGVTRVTDATPANGKTELSHFRHAQRIGALPQRLRIMGDLSLSSEVSDEWLEIAEFKIIIDEPTLPKLDDLISSIKAAHEAGRGVAIHSVTRTEIHFALAALEAAGARTGDRLEHASVTPDAALGLAHQMGLSIVTQPNFVSERGDAYIENVDARDRGCLYRVRSWLEAGVPLAAGTDAPFGDPDPWRAIRAAVNRQTETGVCLGPDEIISPESALGLFSDGFLISNRFSKVVQHEPTDGINETPRSLTIGQRADLCLLNAPWREVRKLLTRDCVAATFCDGRIIWSATD